MHISLYHCGIKPIPDRIKTSNIKIGIMEKQTSIEFQADERFDVFSYDGQYLTSGSAGDRCLVNLQNNQQAQIGYLLLVNTFYEGELAQKTLEEVKAKGLSAVIKRKRQNFVYKKHFDTHTVYQVCLEPVFSTKETAETYKNDISSKQYTTIMPIIKKLPAGTVRLQNLNNNDEIISKHYLRVIGNKFTLNIKVGSGYHFEKTENRSYKGRLNFIIDRYGMLTMVNELPIEEYLSGVVASEMNADFPIEALKAQAVTARTYTISQLDKHHRLDPFDLCDEVHCQAFSGVTNVSPNIARAVQATAGKVLMYQDKICETFYSSVCGGHTEHNENIWPDGTSLQYLRGIFDFPQETAVAAAEDFLTQERNIRKWIEGEPDAYCNINTISILPDYLEFSRKYFRWQVHYTQSELTQIIKEKTGEDIGYVLDIVPIQRGISGRLMKIRIKGSRKSITIENDLEIRKALSNNSLYSSCFVLDKVSSGYGIPQKFIIKGAGWGHGVGMCQTGAAIMALKGKKYQQILRHYYQNTTIESID